MTIAPHMTEAVFQHLPAMQEDPARFVESEAYGHFYTSLYDAGLIIPFDWMEWSGQAQEYVNRPELIEGADIETIRKLITTHVRTDRFCDGHLKAMVLSGHIAAILRRLQELTGDVRGWHRFPTHCFHWIRIAVSLPAASIVNVPLATTLAVAPPACPHLQGDCLRPLVLGAQGRLAAH